MAMSTTEMSGWPAGPTARPSKVAQFRHGQVAAHFPPNFVRVKRQRLFLVTNPDLRIGQLDHLSAPHTFFFSVVGSLSAAELASRTTGTGPSVFQDAQVDRPSQAEATHFRLARLRLTQLEPLLLPINRRYHRQLLA